MKRFKQLVLSGIIFSMVASPTVFAEESSLTIDEAYQTKLEEVYEEELSYYIEMEYPAVFSYSLHDIDQNGIEELILLEDSIAKHVYTFDEEKEEVVFLEDLSAPFTHRDYILITEDGFIFRSGSNGASSGLYSGYKIEENGVEVEELYKFLWDYSVNSDKPYYKLDDPETFYTESEFLELVDSRYFVTEQDNMVEFESMELDYPIKDFPRVDDSPLSEGEKD